MLSDVDAMSQERVLMRVPGRAHAQSVPQAMGGPGPGHGKAMPIKKFVLPTKFASKLLTVSNDKLSSASISLSWHVLHASTRAGNVFRLKRHSCGNTHAHHEERTVVRLVKLDRGFSN